MSPLSVLVIALSMSADAFAAAVARGVARQPSWPQAIRAGAVFGAIETLTPFAGWAVGTIAAGYVAAIDHWIAFVLLGLVGGKMIYEGLWGESDEGADEMVQAARRRRGLIALIATAFATSIDAAAIGVTLAFIEANIVVIGLAIGLTTFVLTTIGMRIGRAVGARFGAWVEVMGGVGIMLIGVGILLDHTGMLG